MKYPKTHTPQKPNQRGIHNNKTQPVKNPSRFCHGGHSERETPGPIPNPEVKPPSADGTAHASVWESKTPPDNTPNAPTTHQLWGRNHTPTKNHHPTGLDSREMPYKLEVRVTDARVPTGKGALSMERMFGPEDGATSSVSCPRRPFGEEQR